MRAVLRDFDVVYSAHITSYGAVPAALQHFPGAETTMHLLWATEAQHRVLRQTEPNYDVVMLEGLDLRLEGGGAGPRAAETYVSRHGLLALHGAEVALAAVRATGRQVPAMTEEEVLCVARDRVAPGLDLDVFILENTRDHELRRRRSDQLGQGARRFRYPRWRLVSD